jgi:hypothetical protein
LLAFFSPQSTILLVSAETKTPLVPLIAWLLPQLISLSLSAAQVRFSYRWADPPQKWALEQLLAVQIGVAVLLLRWMGNATFSIQCLAGGCVMLGLAHVLAIGSSDLLRATAGLGLWVLLMFSLGTDRYWREIRAALLLWAFGGVLLAYSSAEFGGEGWKSFCSPIATLIHVCQQQTAATSSWIAIIGLNVLSFGRFFLRERFPASS